MNRLLPTLLALALPFLVAAPALADDGPMVVLDPEPFPLGGDAVRAAISAEPGLSGAGVLTITMVGDHTARIDFTSPGVDPQSRTIDLPALPAEAIETIALIAGNLALDQTADLLAALDAAPVVAVQPALWVAPEVDVAPPRPRSRHLPFTLGLLPMLSVDRLLGGDVVVQGGLHAVAGATTGVEGFSVSGAIDVQTKFVAGAQIAGAVAVSGDVTGLQLAGATTIARRVRGAQIAGAVAVAGTVDGLQLAPFNIAGKVRGLQLGVLNISDDMEGLPIGVISIVRHGRTETDAWVESTGFGAVALRHGSRRFHNVYALGFSQDRSELPMLGYGLGVQRRPSRRVSVDVDVMSWNTAFLDDRISLLNQARATVGYDLGPADVLVGVAGNVLVSDGDDGRDLEQGFARRRTEPMGEVGVTVWPSVFVGVRVR